MKIVDEFTGRIMEGRRWSEGLHQAIEAKEGVAIREENVTLATITLQNYFRLYEKLAGMTGTAKTEEKEFVEIYNLHVVEIPTNVAGRARRPERLHLQVEGREMGRRPRGHRRAARARSAGARGHDRRRDLRVPLRAAHPARHPAQRAQREGARARGRHHQGGRPQGAVTIATNMAGRGVDIILGDGVVEARRALRARHRAARGAPDRQPATRPLGPPGRPGRVPLLPLRPGRPRAPLRRRPDPRDHGALQDPGRPADGGGDPLEADRERAEEGRGAELRRAQERPQVRRRDEHAADGDLRAAPQRARGRRPLRRDPRVDRGSRRDERGAVHRRRRSRTTGTSTGLVGADAARSTAPT